MAWENIASQVSSGRIVTSWIPWMATANSFHGRPTSADGPVFANRADRIGAARGCESTAGANHGTNKRLVAANRQNETLRERAAQPPQRRRSGRFGIIWLFVTVHRSIVS